MTVQLFIHAKPRRRKGKILLMMRLELLIIFGASLIKNGIFRIVNRV